MARRPQLPVAPEPVVPAYEEPVHNETTIAPGEDYYDKDTGEPRETMVTNPPVTEITIPGQAARAVQLPEDAPPSVEPKKYEVLYDKLIMFPRQGMVRMTRGKVITDAHYDIEALKNQGLLLRELG